MLAAKMLHILNYLQLKQQFLKVITSFIYYFFFIIQV